MLHTPPLLFNPRELMIETLKVLGAPQILVSILL